MKRFLLFFIIASGLIVSQVRAEEKAETKTNPSYLQPILGHVEPYATIARSIGSYCSIYGSNRDLNANDGLVIVGTHRCEEAYLAPKDFYEVAFRGKTYYADVSQVRVSEADLARLMGMTAEDAQDYKEFAMYATKRNWLDQVETALKKLKRTAPYGVAILKASAYPMSEYTDGMGFSVTYYNTSKKTIKYITAHFIGYNAVKDPVKEWRAKSARLTLKGVGPIEPGTSATYTRDYAWMTNLVDTFDITDVTIQYMDGGKKTIKTPNKIWLDPSTYNTLKEFGEEDDGNDDSSVEDSPVAAPGAQ